MPVVGDKAIVISSNCFHSKKCVGQTGTAEKKLNESKPQLWVLKFPSSAIEGELGLYANDELVWPLKSRLDHGNNFNGKNCRTNVK